MILHFFLKGGPVMWPILILSILTVAVVLERIVFLIRQQGRSDQAAVRKIFDLVEHGRYDEAIQAGRGTRDMLALTLASGLEHRDTSLSEALVEGASTELDQYNRGLVMLDTAVTLGPLLGLLGTVFGMMRAFGLVANEDLAGKTAAITGGISEALIAVAFGLAVAIVAIIPLNYLHARMERARRLLEMTTTRLELLMSKKQGG
ncbi:MAG: MotA/TolQ/ExbB proton channel family protein [Chthoniobacterales bacterium]